MSPPAGTVYKSADFIDAVLQVDAPAAFTNDEDELIIGIDGGRSKEGGDGDWSNDIPPKGFTPTVRGD